MNNKRLGGKLCREAFKEWWDSFATMCVYVCQTRKLSRGDVGRFRKCSLQMAKAY